MNGVNGINLTPAWRKSAARRAKRCRIWMAGCAAYGATLIVAYGVCYGQWHAAGAQVHDDVADANCRIDETGRVIARTDTKLTEARLALRVNRILNDRPDWSVVLRLVASTLGDDLVLRECKLIAAIADSRSQGDASTPSRRELILHMRGLARSQASISQYALRLEQTSLFGKVTVLETKREPFLTPESVAFTVTCTIEQSTVAP